MRRETHPISLKFWWCLPSLFRRVGAGYGFYYSIMKSFYLCHSFSGTNSCTKKILPGQHNFTTEQYTAVVKQQVTELWSEYGNLTESNRTGNPLLLVILGLV